MDLIDADAHVNPPPLFWRDYLPASLRDLAPQLEARHVRPAIGGHVAGPIPLNARFGEPRQPGCAAGATGSGGASPCSAITSASRQKASAGWESVPVRLTSISRTPM
jgi:hypothetical protein